MKVTSVELHPANSSDICVLSFRDPGGLNPYNVKGISGLDAEEITPRYYGGSGGSAKFYNLSLEKRAPVFRIGLNPRFKLGESASSLRDALYRAIASSRTGVIQVLFKDGLSVKAAISGFVTKLEAPHFEKTSEVLITLRCDDPWLKAQTETMVDVDDLEPADTEINDILSTAPHGFKFEMEFDTATASFNMEDPNDPTWNFTVTPSGGFLIGDVLYFSSEHNNKYLYLVRGPSTIHLADVISSGSVWPIMFPGINSFSVDNPANMEWAAISYYPTYWGV